MITLIRPILFAFLQSTQVKKLIVDLLTKLAESTDNEVDDKAVEFIKKGGKLSAIKAKYNLSKEVEAKLNTL